MMLDNYFTSKKITLMGLGLLGRGVGDAEFLARHGAELIVTDLKTEEELASSVDRLRQFENVTFRLGEHNLEDFKNRDFILKAAGVPLDSPYIAAAREAGVPIEMSTSLFVRLAGIYTVGITGTRGKSTVTQMVYEALIKARQRGVLDRNVFLGGNVRGVSTLALLEEVQSEDIVVLELDSWQLQGFGESVISPNLAVFTNFMPDHLNYYKGDLHTYFQDKANIYLNQKAEDTFITTAKVVEQARSFEFDEFPGDLVLVGEELSIPELTVPGEHNQLNARLAKQALLSLGLGEEVIDSSLREFSGVSGRLEKVGEVGGVSYWNDTTATTPQAAVAAIKALKDMHDLVVIAGGSEKNIDSKEFADELVQSAREVVLLPGTGTDKLKELLRGTRHESAPECENMAEAVKVALDKAREGSAVLLSPGFTSFGLFKNEFDRGDQFVLQVRKLA